MANPVKSLDDLIRRVGDAGTIRAYHGSPVPDHFDRFDAKFINSGEGNQAFGYGHYSAQQQGVADNYRRSLSYKRLRETFLNTLPQDADGGDVMAALPTFDHRQQRFLRELAENDWLGFDYPAQAIGQSLGRQSGFAGYDVSDAAHAARGQLGTGYELEIAYPESALLDLDAPISSQPQQIQEALGDFAKAPWHFSLGPDDWRGRNAYIEMANKMFGGASQGGQREASEFLAGRGVPGVRYLDGASRPGSEGTRNYVMFPGTEDSIRILRKYGMMAPVAAEAVSQTEE
jgi:hypothetical protein